MTFWSQENSVQGLLVVRPALLSLTQPCAPGPSKRLSGAGPICPRTLHGVIRVRGNGGWSSAKGGRGDMLYQAQNLNGPDS